MSLSHDTSLPSFLYPSFHSSTYSIPFPNSPIYSKTQLSSSLPSYKCSLNSPSSVTPHSITTTSTFSLCSCVYQCSIFILLSLCRIHIFSTTHEEEQSRLNCKNRRRRLRRINMELWGSLASFLGVLAFIQTLLYTIFPPELRLPLVKLVYRVLHYFSSSSHYSYFDITEIIDGVNTNELYNAVQLYLSTTTSIISNNTARLTLTRPINSSSITFGLSSTNNSHTISDTFRNVPVTWEHVVSQRQTHSFSWQPVPDEKRGFTLRIRDKDKPIILTAYLDHIMQAADEIRRKNQDRLLYTNSRGGGSLDARGHHPWEAVPFKHPSTFNTLAMDSEKKLDIMQDLKDFADGQSFYQKTGRAWKRGYLLYGPPGTGKSSMIAAMANYMGYDIYDLELSEVHTNSELRKLLMKTTSRSIIVIEDIDCSISLSSRKKSSSSCSSVSVGVVGSHHQCDMEGSPSAWGEEVGKNSITLSGLLNFTDGLWSCFGSERIFVFTTNHIDKIDPALLRCGRMDMHILMSYCSYPAIKILLKNYLDYNEEDLEEGIWRELEEVVDKAEMTPADISEVLIKNKRNKDVAVKELLLALQRRASRRSPSSSSSNGTTRCKYGAGDEDSREGEEEQEKRALENPDPRDRDDDEFEETCVKGEDDDKKKQEQNNTIF